MRLPSNRRISSSPAENSHERGSLNTVLVPKWHPAQSVQSGGGSPFLFIPFPSYPLPLSLFSLGILPFFLFLGLLYDADCNAIYTCAHLKRWKARLPRSLEAAAIPRPCPPAKSVPSSCFGFRPVRQWYTVQNTGIRAYPRWIAKREIKIQRRPSAADENRNYEGKSYA